MSLHKDFRAVRTWSSREPIEHKDPLEVGDIVASWGDRYKITQIEFVGDPVRELRLKVEPHEQS
jgi:hypothetical protein